MTNTKVQKKKKDYQYNKIISDRNRVIFKEMFKDEDEAKIYSNIPFLYVERAIQIPENPNEKLIMSEGKEFDEYDGLTENQFIYKISHKNYQPNPDLNSFKTNKGVKRGFVSRELKSAVNRNKNNFNLYSNSYKDLNINNAIIENDLNNLNSIDKGKRCLSGSVSNKTRNLSSFSQNKNNKGKYFSKSNIKNEDFSQNIINKTEVNTNSNNNQSNNNSIKKHNIYSFSSELKIVNSNKGKIKKNLKKLNKNNIRLNINKYNNFDKEYRIITNQPIIYEKQYKKYKFNLLKGLMQGVIESKK